MKQDIKKFSNNIYQIDVFMEDKPGRMSCYYIDSTDPIPVSYTHLTLPTTFGV